MTHPSAVAPPGGDQLRGFGRQQSAEEQHESRRHEQPPKVIHERCAVPGPLFQPHPVVLLGHEGVHGERPKGEQAGGERDEEGSRGRRCGGKEGERGEEGRQGHHVPGEGDEEGDLEDGEPELGSVVVTAKGEAGVDAEELGGEAEEIGEEKVECGGGEANEVDGAEKDREDEQEVQQRV